MDKVAAKYGGKEKLRAKYGKDIPPAIMAEIMKATMPIIQEQRKNRCEKQMPLMQKRMQGITFYTMLKPENDPHYVGGGVKLGTPDRPILWYKPTGAEKYRVIYADLSVKEMGADEVKKLPAAGGENVALNPGPSEAPLKTELLKIKSVKESVAEAEVIVVATFVDSAPAKPNRPGEVGETSIRFHVVRVLKGKFEKKVITTQSPGMVGHTAELAGKEWILMLTPAYLAGKHPYAGLYTIKMEPEIRAAILTERQPNDTKTPGK